MLINIYPKGTEWVVMVTGQDQTEIRVPDQQAAERIAMTLIMGREAAKDAGLTTNDAPIL